MEAAAAKLMDFSQPMDVPLLDQVVTTAFDAGHPQVRQQQSYFNRVEKKMGWVGIDGLALLCWLAGLFACWHGCGLVRWLAGERRRRGRYDERRIDYLGRARSPELALFRRFSLRMYNSQTHQSYSMTTSSMLMCYLGYVMLYQVCIQYVCYDLYRPQHPAAAQQHLDTMLRLQFELL